MSETAFIITIDTEGDNLWSKPRVITTHNARFLPRFQSLCERFGFRPVYLTNYEMAICDVFVEFGHDLIARRAGEIGMHLHAWNSPPLVPLTDDDLRHQPYLIEYPDAVMKAKIKLMTQLLQEQFGQPIVSHRAGRFAFDGRYAAMLLEQDYRVDCSVTPGIDWSATPGAPGGTGGTNYSHFPDQPYFLRPCAISAPAPSGLLEVPVTIETGRLKDRRREIDDRVDAVPGGERPAWHAARRARRPRARGELRRIDAALLGTDAGRQPDFPHCGGDRAPVRGPGSPVRGSVRLVRRLDAA